jgi:REP element-mobilizing transposase RayT
VKVYAYCLMTNHVHLLLCPDNRRGLEKLMKRLAGRQTRYHNTLEGRSGTLWEGRYKSSVVEADAYLLPCILSSSFLLQATRFAPTRGFPEHGPRAPTKLLSESWH